MLSISETAHLLNRLKLKDFVKTTIRYASNKKKKKSTDRALKHFDEVYGNLFGKRWWHIRSALLSENTRYVAVVNNFGDVDETVASLQHSGAVDLKTIYDTRYEMLKERRDRKKVKEEEYALSQNLMTSEGSHKESVEAIQDTLADDNFAPKSSEQSVTDGEKKPFGLTELRSIEPELNEVEINTDRTIHPSNVTTALSQFLPASKIKGFDEDWILESEYYTQYKDNAEFTIQVAKESYIHFPEHLKVYMPTKCGDTQFPKPKMSSTGVFDYFLFDGGSILPVLALDLKLGDNVLDMCAAPGGKSLAVLQTLMPRFMICNDIMESRTNRIRNILKEYIPDINLWKESLFITQQDGRMIEDVNVYNKILVDVPCTTDRHVLHEDENNIFKPARTKERLRLPLVQSQILMNAIKLVVIGGTVVYSTCSLNPLENDGVVQMALKRAREESNHVMVVKDMSEALYPLRTAYTFDSTTLKYGHIIIPTHEINCGPMYFCKMVKVQ